MARRRVSADDARCARTIRFSASQCVASTLAGRSVVDPRDPSPAATAAEGSGDRHRNSHPGDERKRRISTVGCDRTRGNDGQADVRHRRTSDDDYRHRTGEVRSATPRLMGLDAENVRPVSGQWSTMAPPLPPEKRQHQHQHQHQMQLQLHSRPSSSSPPPPPPSRTMSLHDTMDNERLIAAVAAYPELYDTSLNPYRDGQRKDTIWNMIACNLKHSSAECKTRWKNLRDSFVKILRSGGVTKRGVAKRPWRYAKQMEFLVPFVQIKRTSNGYRYRREALVGQSPLTAEGCGVCLASELPMRPPSSSSAALALAAAAEQAAERGWDERVSSSCNNELRRRRRRRPRRTSSPMMTAATTTTATATERDSAPSPGCAGDRQSSPPLRVQHQRQQQPQQRQDCAQFAAAAASRAGLFDVLCPAAVDRRHTAALNSGDESLSDDAADDEDELFMKSLVPCLRRLPPPKRSYAKLIIQQLLYELQFYT